MDTITIFEFVVLDQATGKDIHISRKATKEAIALIGGKPIMKSAQRVDVSRLDDNGFLATL
jgi:hypothetical protein